MQGPQLRKYGVSTTINFELFEVDGIDFRVDAVHAAGDSVIMKNEGAEASTTNGFTDEGKGYSLVLTATEMQAARIVIYLADLTATKVWLDKSIVIETYGHASAMHAFDLNTAKQGVNIVSSNNIDLTVLQKASVSSTVLTTALTEAYAVDGVEPTLSQILYMIWSLRSSLGFILTTGTARKLDGATPAMTFTIDDPDNPTDINRET